MFQYCISARAVRLCCICFIVILIFNIKYIIIYTIQVDSRNPFFKIIFFYRSYSAVRVYYNCLSETPREYTIFNNLLEFTVFIAHTNMLRTVVIFRMILENEIISVFRDTRDFTFPHLLAFFFLGAQWNNINVIHLYLTLRRSTTESLKYYRGKNVILRVHSVCVIC